MKLKVRLFICLISVIVMGRIASAAVQGPAGPTDSSRSLVNCNKCFDADSTAAEDAFCGGNPPCATLAACGVEGACPAGFRCAYDTYCDPADPPNSRDVCVPDCPKKSDSCPAAGQFDDPNDAGGFPNCAVPAMGPIGITLTSLFVILAGTAALARRPRPRAE
jgi:hypothetical protein